VCGEQHPVIAITHSVSQHRFVGCAHPVDRFADRLKMHLPAAEKAGQVEYHRLDPVVVRRRVECAHQIARLVFANRRGLGEQRLQRIDPAAFLDHIAIQLDQQGTLADLPGAGPR